MIRLLSVLMFLIIPSYGFAAGTVVSATLFSAVDDAEDDLDSADEEDSSDTTDFTDEKDGNDTTDSADEENDGSDAADSADEEDDGNDTTDSAEKNPEEDEEDSSDSNEDEADGGDDFSSDKNKDESDSSDDFAPHDAQATEEDDFVMEKRTDKVAASYKQPDIAKVAHPAFMYLAPDIKSKKMFELYKNDEMEIIGEQGTFYHTRFLGKEGWVPMADIRLNKWHSYRLYLDLTGGIAWGGGDMENYSIIGNYNLALHVSIVDFLSAAAVFKSFSLDTDAFYVGGGVQARYLVHGLRTKNSRLALTFGGGYLSTTDKPAVDSENITFQGYYIEGAVDYIYRVWERIYVGIGGDITYFKLWGSTQNDDITRDGVQGGVHLKMIVNLYR